jgi:hypothetical protein
LSQSVAVIWKTSARPPGISAPTFEPVARYLYRELVPEVPGLTSVELEDRTYGSRTRYLPSPLLPGRSSASRDR